MAVYERKDGTYVVDKQHDGATVYKRIGRGPKAKKRAQLIHAEIEREIELGKYGDFIKPIKFKRFAEEYLDFCQVNKAPATYAREKFAIRSRILPYFKERKLSALKTKSIEEYKLERSKVAMPSTVNTELKILKCMFRHAVEWDYLTANPATAVKKIREVPAERVVLSPDQITLFFEACKSSRTKSLYPFVVVGFNTGLRRGELYNLLWQDVDFANKCITVVNQGESFQTKPR